MSQFITFGKALFKQIFVLIGLVFFMFTIASTVAAAPADDFVITVKTDNVGTSANTEFTIPTVGTGYNYNVDCNGDGSDEATGVTGDYTCDFSGLTGSNPYTVRIKDNSGAGTGFPRIYFNNGGDRLKLLSVDQWGTGKWTSMANAFFNAQNMNVLASDAPDLSGVTDMLRIFRATALDASLGSWDVSNITSMQEAFYDTDSFAPTDLGLWDVGNVRNFQNMFGLSTQFNDPSITTWNIGENTGTLSINMSSMFNGAVLFNQDLDTWETNIDSTMAYVSNMSSMFLNASAFNGTIGAWDVGRVTNFYQFMYRNGEMQFNNGEASGVQGTGMNSWNIGANIPAGSTINMFRMFRGNYNFNQDISSWDVTKVTNFSEMFLSNFVFEGTGLSNWKISGTNTDPVAMNSMFQNARVFNQPLATWETDPGSTMKYVTSTASMFNGALIFNQPLGDWDMGRVTNFGPMFANTNAFADLAPSINTWRIGENTGTDPISMQSMFQSAQAFNTDLQSWQTGASSTMEYVTNIAYIFNNADSYNQSVGIWDVGRVTLFNGAFRATAIFDDPAPSIANWTISKNTGTTPINFYELFNGALAFNTDLSAWETSPDSTTAHVFNMRLAFNGASSFNQPLGDWDMGRVTSFQNAFSNMINFSDPAPSINNWHIGENTGTTGINMLGMFSTTPNFNSPLASWETDPNSTMANVTTMRNMFRGVTGFDQPIDVWNVGRVTSFYAMFFQNKFFDQPLNNWNLGVNHSSNIDVESMFAQAVFNQPLNNWDVTQVTNFRNMFTSNADFNQSLAAWEPTAGTIFTGMLNNSGLSTANYDDTLIGWSQQDLADGEELGAVGLEYCASEPFRASLVADQGWTITGDTLDCAPGSVSGAGVLRYWLNAGSILGADNSFVSNWPDISGDGRHFTQGVAGNQPTLLKNINNAVNFNPLVHFDGVDDYLEGHDFNLTAPITNLVITNRSATSELVETRGPLGGEYDITFGVDRSVIGGQFNGNGITAGSWRPASLPAVGANTTEYLELDLGSVEILSSITTQGEGSNQEGDNWTETYTVEVSTDNTTFTQLGGTFTGNTDKGTQVENRFSVNTKAQYVRIYPQTWTGYPALRVGVGTASVPDVTTFVLAIEDGRQDNVTQSLNEVDATLQLSVANGDGNADYDYDFTGIDTVSVSGSVPVTTNKPFLTMFGHNGDGDTTIYHNGTEVARATSTVPRTVIGQTYVAGLPAGNYFNGKIAEASFLETDLAQDQREKINTYFAIKYNIPLDHNFIYELEVGGMATIWDKTINATYDNDVFGLAVDGEQGLNQKVSSTRDDNDRVLTIATTNNFTGMNNDVTRSALSGDPAFVIIGNDDGAETLSSLGAPTGYEMLDRRWYPQITGGDQDLHFQFNVEDAGFDIEELSVTSDYYFISDTDGDGNFNDETPVALTEGATGIWFNTSAITLEDGQIFTLATDDTAGPDVTINQKSGQADPTSVLPLTYTVVFSEPIIASTFIAADISSASSTAPGVSITGVTQVTPNNGTTFEVTTTATAGGDVILTIPAGVVNDVNGNSNETSTSTDNVMTYDITLPANPTITSPVDGAIVTSPLTVTGVCEPNATVHISSSDITPSPTNTTCTPTGTYAVAVTIDSGVSGLTLTADQTDTAGNTSGSVSTTVEFDEDGDGNPSTIEDAGNNGGDGNGDGTDDSEQEDVSGVPNSLTRDYTTLESAGTNCAFITQNSVVAEGALAAQDPSHDYPVGLVDFQLECTNPGDSADVVIYYGQEYDTSNWEWRKFDSLGNAYSDISSLVTYATSTLGTTTVTTASFTVTDGDPLTDEDGTADRFINDPSGPAVIIASSGGGGGAAKRVCRDPEASNYKTFGKSDSRLCEYEEEPEVEETTTTPTEVTVTDSVCSPYLTETIALNRNNDSSEVEKLQNFLNNKQGENLTVDGIYNQDDFEAVKRFQEKYRMEVLDIWGLTQPTGYVYLTTRNKINSFYCSQDIECPYFTEYNSTTQNTQTNEVLKTKILLQELGFYNGTLNESWGTDMKTAMIKFQETFKATMLTPWNLTKGTGYKYKTTNRFLNNLVGCKLPPETLENGTTVSY